MDENCLFCKILHGEVPSNKVYEDENVFAFLDINPQAETHLLFIHRNHTPNIVNMTDTHPQDLQDLFVAISTYSKEKGLYKKGFRVVSNIGESSGQTVFHTHIHILSDVRLGKFGS
ncbi:MAG: HIT domain-containing protein [Bacteriovoracaceae bacterium]|nr:HIT domain-containing protein [Bacteriovoracaceae bacterium]